MKMDMRAFHAAGLAVEFEGFVANTTGEHVASVVTHDGPGGADVEHEITTEHLTQAAILLRERSHGLTLADEQCSALRVALHALPYSATVTHKPLRTETLIEDACAYLAAYTVQLHAIREQGYIMSAIYVCACGAAQSAPRHCPTCTRVIPPEVTR